MSHRNALIDFLRHYGPIASCDNMYDESIRAVAERYKIESAIEVQPVKLKNLVENFESKSPQSVILTGTAGDGKTYHCRRIWEYFKGDAQKWQEQKKIIEIDLPESGKRLVIIKDLSELSLEDKKRWISEITLSFINDGNKTFLVAANDGQLIATWRGWSESSERHDARSIFKIMENMLVENKDENDELNLYMYNLSRIDASEYFDHLTEKIVEHPQWNQCNGCKLLNDDGSSNCPIRINRDLLKNKPSQSVFRERVKSLLKLASANRMHLPIRDLLLLCVNIILGDRKLIGQDRPLMNCRTAQNRAGKNNYKYTNPYANTFGANLKERRRQQYQIFVVLESFGIGRETDNKFDNLLVYGKYENLEKYRRLISQDKYYGGQAYDEILDKYLEGDHAHSDDFIQALSHQRQRLFFQLSSDEKDLDPWELTVYRSSGEFLKFIGDIRNGMTQPHVVRKLIVGLNRTFCGMMIEDNTKLYLATSGGDGRGRIASILCDEILARESKRFPHLKFYVSPDAPIPRLSIIDPTNENNVAHFVSIELQLTHFEYLLRVADGSLPSSFSRQCHEDFLDFKLRLIEKLYSNDNEDEVVFRMITVEDSGQVRHQDVIFAQG